MLSLRRVHQQRLNNARLDIYLYMLEGNGPLFQRALEKNKLSKYEDLN